MADQEIPGWSHIHLHWVWCECCKLWQCDSLDVTPEGDAYLRLMLIGHLQQCVSAWMYRSLLTVGHFSR